MNPGEAVIFDMDGVLVDSEPLHEQAFQEVLDQIGYGQNHGLDFSAYYGKSDRVVWQDFFARHQPGRTLDELADWKQRRFFELLKRDEPVFETLPELLEKLSSRYRLGLASGSAHRVIREVLALKNLRRFFSATVSAEDVVHGKPAPDIFLRTAELLRVRPERCWVIEDSVAGVEGAVAAGMRVIGITNTFSASDLKQATHVVDSYAAIEHLLLFG
ncbi:MAG: HAD family phosphatase [Verrucomicrobia bacterium]|nr:HAD family phosphatase [Verrucomicrobiota bacterium]